MPADIDPKEFGALTAQVAILESQVQDMQQDIKALLALANQSKGGFWAGMAIASALGAVASWFISNFILHR